MNTNLSKADSLFRKENFSKMARVNSRAFLFPLIVGFLICFLHSPVLAQQEGEHHVYYYFFCESLHAKNSVASPLPTC